MTLQEWLDEPQTVTTRRQRMHHFLGERDSHHTREMMLSWLAASWNAGIESGQVVDRDDPGRVI
jgi:hypothetical protein